METKTITKQWNEFEDFNVGDVVKLKSGGPNMTVENASSSRIICKWFDATNILFVEDFDQGALEKVAVAPSQQLAEARALVKAAEAEAAAAIRAEAS